MKRAEALGSRRDSPDSKSHDVMLLQWVCEPSAREQWVDLVKNNHHKQGLNPPVHSVQVADPVAQIKVLANEMIHRCHALRQGEPMPGSRSGDCLRKPYLMGRSNVSDQHAKGPTRYSISRCQCGNSKFVFF